MKTIDDETKKKNGLCMYPTCEERGTEEHHIIFRSETKKTVIIEDPRFRVRLCPFHHRLGQNSPHRRRVWREYYYRFLPENWKDIIDECTTTRRKRKVKTC